MDYSRSISFVFKDPDWFKKIIVGGLLNFFAWFTGIFFFVCFFTFGYTIAVIRHTINNSDLPLPEWNDMGKKFVDGLLGALIFLIYTIGFGVVGGLWIVYVANAEFMNEATQILMIVLGALFIFLGIVYFGTAGLAFYAANNDFVAAFRMGQLWQFIHADLASFTLMLFFSLILHLILLIVSLVILSPFTGFWGNLVIAHLLGQYAARFREQITPEPAAATAG